MESGPTVVVREHDDVQTRGTETKEKVDKKLNRKISFYIGTVKERVFDIDLEVTVHRKSNNEFETYSQKFRRFTLILQVQESFLPSQESEMTQLIRDLCDTEKDIETEIPFEHGKEVLSPVYGGEDVSVVRNLLTQGQGSRRTDKQPVTNYCCDRQPPETRQPRYYRHRTEQKERWCRGSCHGSRLRSFVASTLSFHILGPSSDLVHRYRVVTRRNTFSE